MSAVIVDRHALLTRAEAAEFLNIRPQTLSVWAMTGKGPPVIKLQRSVRYRLSDLEAWVRKNTIGGDL